MHRNSTRSSSLAWRLVLLTVLATAGGIAAAPPSWARPSATPSPSADATYMTDGQVRAIQHAGGHLWIGGAFDRLLKPDTSPGRLVPGIAALDPGTSAPAAGVTIPALGGNPFVYDLSTSGDILYAAGRFTYTSKGKNYWNLVGLNATTGAIVSRFRTPPLRCVFATPDRILAGGETLRAYETTGKRIRGFVPLVPKIDPTIRGHETPSLIRDIVVSGGTGFAVGQFDLINGEPQKVAVRFDPDTGSVTDWHLTGLQPRSGAFGIQMRIDGTRLFVAAGGSDFTAAYDASNGNQLWKTDTSGSTQTLGLWDTDTLIIGGHFQWVELGTSGNCGDNQHPNPECLNQPRLAALDASTGDVDPTWLPQICCAYNGVWQMRIDAGHLHVGGQFTKAGGRVQTYYARFS